MSCYEKSGAERGCIGSADALGAGPHAAPHPAPSSPHHGPPVGHATSIHPSRRGYVYGEPEVLLESPDVAWTVGLAIVPGPGGKSVIADTALFLSPSEGNLSDWSMYGFHVFATILAGIEDDARGKLHLWALTDPNAKAKLDQFVADPEHFAPIFIS